MSVPPVIHTHYSNRTEHLVGALADVVSRPCGGPFDRDTIVVQGRGMAAYLTQQLATRLGVWGNPDFRFPRRYLETCLAAVWPQEAGAGATVDEDQLTWLVLAELDRCLDDPAFARLRRYLENDPQGMKRFSLARRLGTLFDRYITFRPEMVQAFSAGKDGGVEAAQLWQAELWRRIEPRLPASHWAARERAWHDRVQGLPQRPLELPPRVCLFGISTLPSQYLRVIAAASRWVETHLFVFSPSDRDWWNSATRVEWARLVTAGQDPDALYVDQGHPLLSSCGIVGADFRRVLQGTFEALGLGEAEHDWFEPPPSNTTLTRLQADIFACERPRPAAGPGEAPTAKGKRKPTASAQMALPFVVPEQSAQPTPIDDTIRVHACHSPMREIEVLRDQLLALMTRKHDPVAPHEVVVMMADVQAYAPFVEAVFGVGPHAPTHIPFRIADQKLRADSPVVDAYFRALDLVGSRLSAPAVIDLLSARAIERRLGLAAADLDRLTAWVVDAAIRWGIDADHRAQHGQPADAQNTWRFGLDRLLLGYALPTDGHATFAGVMPYDEIEGKSAADLGVFVDFIERLFVHLRHLQASRDVSAWRRDLLAFLQDLVGEAQDDDWEHQQLRQALADMEAQAASADLQTPVALGIVRAWLEERVEAALPERGFLAGGVTFCAMIPMRSIPFRVVCLVGLNDGVFPRPSRTIEFDLVARGPQGPQPGDRDRRLDDRYLFLETIAAARERLIITYTGQSIRDNAERPPSVLLSELYESLALTIGGASSSASDVHAATVAALVVRHPLQVHSRRYFDGSDARLFSYSSAFRAAAAQTLGSLKPPPRFLAEPLPLVAREPEISLRDLERFWKDPLRFFVQRRARVDFGEANEDIPSREPTQLDPLSQHHVGSLLLQGLRGEAAPPAQEIRTLVRATGSLPLGSLGEVWVQNLLGHCEAIVAAGRSLRKTPLPTLHFDRALSPEVRLVGSLEGLYASGLVQQQFGQIREHQELCLWLRHLVLCWLRPEGVEMRSTLLGREAGGGAREVSFGSVERAEAHLLTLVELFHAGQQQPVPFLPEPGMAFVKPAGGRNKADPMARACAAYSKCVVYKPWWPRIVGEDQPPFEALGAKGPHFTRVAEQVFLPLLAHRQESAPGGGGGDA